MRAQFDVVLRDFQRHLSFDDTLEVVKRNRVRKHGYGPDGHFSQINDLEALDIESTVERRANFSASSKVRKTNSSTSGSAPATCAVPLTFSAPWSSF